MATATPFRPSHSDGTCDRSDQETGGSFATSRVEGQRETVAPGAATGKVVALIAGGELHAEQAGSRVNVAILTGKGLRSRLTASLSPADAERFFREGAGLVPLARAYRQNKGA
ncbi:hypothetical protein [Methylobacterium komagatae]